ncbi:MAG: hypothetical protein IJT97_10340 [Bacteroidaceae bacterium]|nr:hypothetical protein [Bacteroidaceae bacterium]
MSKSKDYIQKITGACRVLARRLRLVRINRNFLVFLIFLAVAIIFWFMQALKEDTSTQFTYNIHITNVPKEVIFTSEVPKTVTVSVTGRGWNILQYLSKNESKEIYADFNEIEKSRSKITLDSNLWRRLLLHRLGNNIKFVASTPSTQDVYYSNGKTKRVPVVFDGNITAELQHLICGIHLNPDSIDIIAPTYLLDSINEVHTKSLDYKGLADTLVTTVPLYAGTGIKVIPDSVKVEICVDLFTEKSLEVPIYCENIPSNKLMRTFPSKAKVTFHVSASLFNDISEKDFIVVVDFEDTKTGNNLCPLLLRTKPEGISHVRIIPEKIEYIIEQAY